MARGQCYRAINIKNDEQKNNQGSHYSDAKIFV